MPLVHGEDIGAAELEREISSWEAVRFARLCNALAWALVWRGAQSVPAFTERVNVADNGIDAEWHGEISDSDLTNSLLLRPGVNVFQYKKREVAERSRAQIVSNLVLELRGAAPEVEARTGRQIANYVLFTNVDLTGAHQAQLRTAIAEGVTSDRINIEVVGAAQLAAMLNNQPHLRSAFFATSAFRDWGESWSAHTNGMSFPQTDFFGREEELNLVRRWLDDPSIRIIALSGFHMMGKSRLALEAVRDRDVSFVEALDLQSLNIDQLRRLEVEGRSTIVLISDLDAKLAERLAQEALSRARLKLIICVPTAEAVPAPSFGSDNRIQPLQLPPLAEDRARRLLTAARSNLDHSLATWILANADGVPGIILAAADVGPSLRNEPGNFAMRVARGFERKANDRLTDNQLSALSLLSLMTHVGVEQNVRIEVELLCTNFNVDLNAVLNAIDPLIAAGFARQDGSYVEVLPPPLANLLAARVIRGRLDAVRTCFEVMSANARRRLTHRLLLLDSDEAQIFWNELLGDGGRFLTLDAIIADAELFQVAGIVDPVRAGTILLTRLSERSVDQLRTIEGNGRRSLIRAIEAMLYTEAGSELALRCLILLAEAENETYANNASGVLKSVFYPLHPQIPLSLTQRRDILRGMLSSEQRIETARLGIDAAANALEDRNFISLRTSISRAPLARRPEMTWSEVWDYLGDCLDLLATACADDRQEVLRTAAARLPSAVCFFISRGNFERGIPHLQTVVNRAMSADDFYNIADLAGVIRWCRDALENPDLGGAEANAEVIETLQGFLDRFRTGPFSIRMRLRLGGWANRDRKENLSAAEAIEALAEEVCANPALLDDDSINWLCNNAVRSGEFWQYVGRLDVNGRFHDSVLALGSRADGVRSFVSYLSGWFERDQSAARAFFDRSAGGDTTAPTAILFGALNVDPPDVGAERIIELLACGRIEVDAISPTNIAHWARNVSQEPLARVLERLAGPDFASGFPVAETLFDRLDQVPLAPGPLAEFLWRYLEAYPEQRWHLSDYYTDQLAARLVALDGERAFALLDHLVRDEQNGDRWEPLASHPDFAFLEALSRVDRNRMLAILLNASQGAGHSAWSVQYHLPEQIDLQRDQDFLLEYARQGQPQAEAVAKVIRADQEAFWPTSFQLVNTYPDDENIKQEIELRIEHRMGQIIYGPRSQHLSECVGSVNAALQMPDIPSSVRQWLMNFRMRLQHALDAQLRGEADERVNRG